MITLKLIRTIGKILRGGAGRKEILLGTLCGILIGFNPEFNFTTLLMVLLALLLNANFAFVMLGIALGKLTSLPLAAVSFHIGYAVIHNMGLEGLFRTLCNAPVTALMDLNVYAMVGSLPLALATGILLGILFGTAVTRIRKKMLEANQHQIIGKTFGNKVSRVLLWLAFGKSKLALEDEIPKQAPLLRKSGLIIVAGMVVMALLFEFFLLDAILRKSIESSIAAYTGAEVNIAAVHFSLARGEIGIEGLQVTDPDNPTSNMLQLDKLVADLNVSELLSRNYAIDLVEGSILQFDVPRAKPGIIYEKPAPPEKDVREDLPGKSIEDYFAQAGKLRKYARNAYDYLSKRKENQERAARGEAPESSKNDALADAERLGYLKASADLYADRPAWLVRKLRIDNVQPGSNLPAQILSATELCSHPELNRKPTSLKMAPAAGGDPVLKLILRFDDPAALHALEINLPGLPIGSAMESSESFPVDISDGIADLKAAGNFSADVLDLPFTILVHNLKAVVEEDGKVMGMDAATATEVLSSMEQLDIDGALKGSLLSPRVVIDYEKLTANMKNALVAAGKKELAKRANAEMDKAKDELTKQAGEEINKLLGGEEGESGTDKAKSVLKKLF